MIKQSKTTIKELTAQYRAVLRHAFLAGIATFAVVSDAVADTTLTEPLSLATQIAEGSAPVYSDGSYTPSNWNSETHSFSDGEKATSEVTNPGEKPSASAQELELSTGSTTLGAYKSGYTIDNAAETPTAITVDVTTYSYEKTAATGGPATTTPLQSTDIVESPVLTKAGYDYAVDPTYYAGGDSSVNIDTAPALTQYTFDGIEDGKTLANYVSYNSETQEYTSTFPDSLVVNGNAALTAYKEALVAYGNVLSNYNDANTKYNNAIQAYKDDQIAVDNAIESYRQSVGSWQASKTSFDNYTAAQTAKNTYDNSLAGAIDLRANNAITASLADDGDIGTALAGKQDALTDVQLAAANSGITADKVGSYDTHVADTDIHVTTDDKTKWNAKQDALTDVQLAATNSGITADKVSTYDGYAVLINANSDNIAELGSRIDGHDDAIAALQSKDNQLRNDIAALDSKMNDLDDNLSAGIASSVALSSVAVANVQKGELSVGGGYGNYNSKSAMAFGAALGISDNWSANAGVGFGFGKDTKASFRIGTNYKFKLF